MDSTMDPNKFMRGKGLHLRKKWLHQCLEYLSLQSIQNVGDSHLLRLVFNVFLDSDMYQSSEGSIPFDILNVDVAILRGLHVLQIDEIIDVGKSSNKEDNETASHKFLKLFLTDGRIQMAGLECKKIPGLSLQVATGSKIAIWDVPVKFGCLLLSPSNTRILGGQVDRLASLQDGPNSNEITSAAVPPGSNFRIQSRQHPIEQTPQILSVIAPPEQQQQQQQQQQAQSGQHRGMEAEELHIRPIIPTNQVPLQSRLIQSNLPLRSPPLSRSSEVVSGFNPSLPPSTSTSTTSSHYSLHPEQVLLNPDLQQNRTSPSSYSSSYTPLSRPQSAPFQNLHSIPATTTASGFSEVGGQSTREGERQRAGNGQSPWSEYPKDPPNGNPLTSSRQESLSSSLGPFESTAKNPTSKTAPVTIDLCEPEEIYDDVCSDIHRGTGESRNIVYETNIEMYEDVVDMDMTRNESPTTASLILPSDPLHKQLPWPFSSPTIPTAPEKGNLRQDEYNRKIQHQTNAVDNAAGSEDARNHSFRNILERYSPELDAGEFLYTTDDSMQMQEVIDVTEEANDPKKGKMISVDGDQGVWVTQEDMWTAVAVAGGDEAVNIVEEVEWEDQQHPTVLTRPSSRPAPNQHPIPPPDDRSGGVSSTEGAERSSPDQGFVSDVEVSDLTLNIEHYLNPDRKLVSNAQSAPTTPPAVSSLESILKGSVGLAVCVHACTRGVLTLDEWGAGACVWMDDGHSVKKVYLDRIVTSSFLGENFIQDIRDKYNDDWNDDAAYEISYKFRTLQGLFTIKHVDLNNVNKGDVTTDYLRSQGDENMKIGGSKRVLVLESIVEIFSSDKELE